MKTFRYKALDKTGNMIVDTIAAGSDKEAETLLLDKKLKILVLEEKKDRNNFGGLFGKGNFPLREKISLCRNLSLLIEGGLPIGESLELLMSGTTSGTVKKVLQDISSSLNQGQSLLSCFAKYPEYFDEVFLAMVKTGETSGTLSRSFEYLAKQFKQEDSLKQKVLSALLYPVIVVILMAGVGILMLTFVLPRLGKAFLGMNIEMPLTTKLLLEFSMFLEKNFILVGIGSIIFIVVSFLALKNKFGKIIFYSIIGNIPVSKKVILEYNLARFTQSLSTLLQAGVPITESLEISVRSLVLMKKDKLANDFKDKITKGIPLSTIFKETKFFPPLMCQIVAVGEKTGNLDKLLVDLSDFYQEEIENSLKNLVTILEPLLMVVIGVAVGAMLIAVISPIYSIIGKIQPH